MPVTYPLSLPSSPAPKSTAFQLSAQAAFGISPFTFKQQVQTHQGQMWTVDVTLPPMTRNDAAAWTAFFTSLRGREGTFYLGDWDARAPRGNGGPPPASSIRVTAAADTRVTDTGDIRITAEGSGIPVFDTVGSPSVNLAGDRVIYTTGWGVSITGILLAGDYIQFHDGTQQRLHMVVNDASSDGSGDALLDIEPALRLDVADLTPITITNTKGLFRMVTNDPGWRSGMASIYNFTFVAQEAL
jgi:hypothetical protein